VYERLLSPGNLFVNDRCTDSILVTSVTVCGDHTGVAYSNNGPTYVIKAPMSGMETLKD